jgi:septal ring factor EnvC (AmiA/AmiB activator)
LAIAIATASAAPNSNLAGGASAPAKSVQEQLDEANALILQLTSSKATVENSLRDSQAEVRQLEVRVVQLENNNAEILQRTDALIRSNADKARLYKQLAGMGQELLHFTETDDDHLQGIKATTSKP